MIRFGAPPSERILPFMRLQGLVKPGRRVRIKIWPYKDLVGVVVEALTTRDDPAFITGAMRYAVRLSDGRVVDLCRHQFAKVPKVRT